MPSSTVDLRHQALSLSGEDTASMSDGEKFHDTETFLDASEDPAVAELSNAEVSLAPRLLCMEHFALVSKISANFEDSSTYSQQIPLNPLYSWGTGLELGKYSMPKQEMSEGLLAWCLAYQETVC